MWGRKRHVSSTFHHIWWDLFLIGRLRTESDAAEEEGEAEWSLLPVKPSSPWDLEPTLLKRRRGWRRTDSALSFWLRFKDIYYFFAFFLGEALINIKTILTAGFLWSPHVFSDHLYENRVMITSPLVSVLRNSTNPAWESGSSVGEKGAANISRLSVHHCVSPADPFRQAGRLPIKVLKMLTARAGHILHPEYLQPLPSTPVSPIEVSIKANLGNVFFLRTGKSSFRCRFCTKMLHQTFRFAVIRFKYLTLMLNLE